MILSSGAIPYQVTKKGQKETDRYNKLLSYEGPDEQTIQLLEERAALGFRTLPASEIDHPDLILIIWTLKHR